MNTEQTIKNILRFVRFFANGSWYWYCPAQIFWLSRFSNTVYLLLFCKLDIIFIFWIVLFHIPYVQSNFQYIFYITSDTIPYILFHMSFVLFYSSWFSLVSHKLAFVESFSLIYFLLLFSCLFLNFYSLIYPILSLISLALSCSVFGIPFFLCSKTISYDIISLMLLMILWVRIRFEHSILSFAGHIPVLIVNPVERVRTSRYNIFFSDWICIFFIACISLFDIFLHTSDPYNINGMRLVSKDLILSLVLHSVLMIFHLSLWLFYLPCFQLPLSAVLDYLLCLALFLINNTLLQSHLPSPLLLFVFISLFQYLLSYILSFSVHIVFFSLFSFFWSFLLLFLLCLHLVLLQFLSITFSPISMLLIFIYWYISSGISSFEDDIFLRLPKHLLCFDWHLFWLFSQLLIPRHDIPFRLYLWFVFQFDFPLYFPILCVCYNKVKPSIQNTDLCLLLLFVLLP